MTDSASLAGTASGSCVLETHEFAYTLTYRIKDPMSELYDFSVEAMTEPIERLFEREFPTEYGIFVPQARLVDAKENTTDIDLLYVAGSSKNLHAIKILPTYDKCLFSVDEGIHSMSQAKGNHLWIGLPLDEFREGEAEYNDIVAETCEERGVGILTVQPRGRGLSAKIISRPVEEEGDFLDYYDGLREEWKSVKDRNMAMDGYEIVDYYSR